MQPTASIHSFFKTRQNCCWKKWSALPGTKAAVREKSNVQHFFSIHPPSPPSARNRILLWDYKVLRQEACNGKAAGCSGTQWQQHILVLLIGGTSKYQKTDVSQQKWCLRFWVSLHALHRGYLHPQLLWAHTAAAQGRTTPRDLLLRRALRDSKPNRDFDFWYLTLIQTRNDEICDFLMKMIVSCLQLRRKLRK